MPKMLEHLGLVFCLYFEDHPPPHIHVKYGEHEAVFNLESNEIITGYLPSKQRKKAKDIINKNKEKFIKEFNKLEKK